MCVRHFDIVPHIYLQCFFFLVFRLLCFYWSVLKFTDSFDISKILLNLSSELFISYYAFNSRILTWFFFVIYFSLLTVICLFIKIVFSFSSLNIFPIHILDIFIIVALKFLPASSNIWAISYLIFVEYGLQFPVSLYLVIFV